MEQIRGLGACPRWRRSPAPDAESGRHNHHQELAIGLGARGKRKEESAPPPHGLPASGSGVGATRERVEGPLVVAAWVP